VIPTAGPEKGQEYLLKYTASFLKHMPDWCIFSIETTLEFLVPVHPASS
jgi:hypothetical protein